jgi:hypothetical protein
MGAKRLGRSKRSAVWLFGSRGVGGKPRSLTAAAHNTPGGLNFDMGVEILLD